jgi:LPPG:FO 2-phospho-L-lactate transferase
MKIVALAGGVGGAKLAQGLAESLPPADLTIIVNTADDFEHLGLRISPDLDTVCYTLAGVANRRTGWGRAKETWHAIETLGQLGGPAWFRVGDRDLATHLERTRRLKNGEPLSQIVSEFCRAWHVAPTVLPMTDFDVRTIVQTDEGDLEFQEYFVHRRCRPRVKGFEIRGASEAAPSPGVVEALRQADGVIICPSNPWVSIGPMLSIPGLRGAVDQDRAVAVSPIIGGKAVKGPADKIFRELGIRPSALAVARQYEHLVSGFVMDKVDAQLAPAVQSMGMRTLLTRTLMRSLQDRRRLARVVLDFGEAMQQ